MHTPAMETSTSIASNNWSCTLQQWKHPRVLPLTTGHAHSSNGNIHEYYLYNENCQETETSYITHAPDLTRKSLTGINETSPKYKVVIIDGIAIVNAIHRSEIINTSNDFGHFFLDQLSNEVKLVSTHLSTNK